ncbi:MAG: hypothetical protein RMI34_09530 [Chloroherpetonaceae bacterium]|nr:hypothetical protein [Chloroherpetonaceae bacterium]MCS7210465.1 hypothetical protein [Chloroherpetonaceae bacterium]MDW8020298.1 hypothetical protein [Chloroherpetonaceae bacterium]MDW8466507.1 hypothetical protein [Chloroherpetonaceae bacterium]
MVEGKVNQPSSPKKEPVIKVFGRWFYRIVLTLIIVQILIALGKWAKSCFYF